MPAIPANGYFITCNELPEKTIHELGAYGVRKLLLPTPMSIIKNIPSAISSVNANGEQAPVEYYTLEGMRVNQQVKGIYIMRQGNKVVKVSNK